MWGGPPWPPQSLMRDKGYNSGEATEGPSLACDLSPNLAQRLIQVCDDVLDVFDSNRDSDETVCDS